jgi:hypothetical protein
MSYNQLSTVNRKGAALLVVLFIVMVATVLALGYVSRSDVELACGKNMLLRTTMDYLAESALAHAKGLIVNPQDLDSEYWAGAERLQLVEGSNDYYDVNVVKLGNCNYQITCEAYREKSGEEIGRSSLKAELRLDPCIALWTGRSMTFPGAMTIIGDMYCNGTLINNGVINGDVFTNSLTGSIAGQKRSAGDLSLSWPRVTASDFISHYSTQVITANSLAGTNLGGPAQVYYRNGDLVLAGNVQIDGILIVDGNLTISGNGNIITAKKNLPAILATGDVMIENESRLDVNGLVVIDGNMRISAGGAGINVLGALFAKGGIWETTADSSGNGNIAMLYNGPTWQPSGGKIGGALQFDGINDYVQTPNSPAQLQLSGDYTLSVWVKADSTQKIWAGIFSKCNASGSANHWTLQFDSSSPRKLIVYHPTASWDTKILLSNVADSWHHISVVRSGNTMSSYLDGNQVYSNTWSNNPGSGTGHLNIGADRTATSNYYVYKGLIDDLRIYDRALDANDIYPPKNGLAGLIGHWKMNEAGSNNITITAAPSKTAIIVWSTSGLAEKWGQADGAFFRSIVRN